MTNEEWAVERVRHMMALREARLRFGFAWALLISILMWVALIEGGIWLLS